MHVAWNDFALVGRIPLGLEQFHLTWNDSTWLGTIPENDFPRWWNDSFIIVLSLEQFQLQGRQIMISNLHYFIIIKIYYL